MNLKKIGAAILAGITAISITACGQPKTSMDIKYDVDKYVALGKYKNLDVTITGDYSTETALQSMIDSAGGYVKDDTQTVVQADSIVNVDYVGKLDGTAFDGGSATDQTIDVANNCMAGGTTQFIDGFTSGLVGASVGSTVDCPVTFPSNYSASNLAGKNAVFTFTVNYICKAVDTNSLTDDFVKEKFNLDSVDALKESAKEKAESTKQSDIRTAVTDALVKNSKIKFPKNMVNLRLKEYEERFKKQYASGTTLKKYLSDNYNMTVDQFESQVKESIRDNLKTELVLEAVAKKQKIKLDQKGYNKYVKNLMSNNSVKTKKALYELVASTADAGEKYLKKMYVDQKACDYCVKHAKVTEKPAESSGN